jgi:predicted TIM-barrel fold metal-dependent hydrolase
VSTAPATGSSPRILDAHVHFWDRRMTTLQWPWLDHFSDRAPVLRAESYTARDYLLDTAALDVSGAVHVQAAESPDPVVESRWLSEMAEGIGTPGAIVAACSLIEPTAAATLRRHASVARVRGIRDMTLPPDVELTDVASALDTVADCGLSVEIRLPLDRFDTLAELAANWPTVTFVLGSAGVPMGPAPRPDAEWASALERLAPHDNWVCKISGLIGRLGSDWSSELLSPFVSGVLETFGAHRSMFGTNWPVESAVADLGEILAAYRAVAGQLPQEDADALCHQTASRVYGFEQAAEQ